MYPVAPKKKMDLSSINADMVVIWTVLDACEPKACLTCAYMRWCDMMEEEINSFSSLAALTSFISRQL